jgi:hypothetical protein
MVRRLLARLLGERCRYCGQRIVPSYRLVHQYVDHCELQR